MPINIADGNEHVTIQVGQVLGRRAPRPETPTAPTGPVEVTNVCTGNATVGRQVDEISGDLRL